MLRKTKRELFEETLTNGVELCPVREACQAYISTKDGYGKVTKEPSKEAPGLCGYETARAISKCKIYLRLWQAVESTK